jgi:diguanylate cyclase (GGDEF)-like protein
MNELLDFRPALPSAAGFPTDLRGAGTSEAERQNALESYEIVESAPEKAYDDIARLAAYICTAPMAFIAFFGQERGWIKARYSSGAFSEKSLLPPMDALPREAPLHEPGQVLQVPDITTHPRLSALAPSGSKLRFLAAAPLFSPTGLILGSLAVLDRRNRTLTPEQVSALETLAHQAMELLEMRRTLIGLSEANAKLGQQNLTDALTGIPNRRAYDQKLAEEASRAKRTGAPLSLLLIDIDHFKQYNDSFGHPAGDTALQSVARVLLSSLRPYDFLARYGGEEFVIVLPATDLADAIVVGERVRGLVAGSDFPHRKLSISVGVARLDPETGPRALVQAADSGLYRAKAAGRNKVLAGKVNDSLPVGSAVA